MPSYIENALIKDEKVIYTGKVSVWALLPHIIIGLVLIGVGVGVVFWVYAAILYYTTEIAFTNKRIIAKFGFISRKTIELNINKIETMQVDQGILGRIFDFGSLTISGAGNPMAPIPHISQPLEFRKHFMEYQDSLSRPVAA